MIDWSVCRTRCQNSLPIKAAFRLLPEWHQPLLQPGFPWQTSKAWHAQAPVPADGTSSCCQLSFEQGWATCSDFCFSFSFRLHHTHLQPLINRYSEERREQSQARGPALAMLWGPLEDIHIRS